jgi:hypothetical protein
MIKVISGRTLLLQQVFGYDTVFFVVSCYYLIVQLLMVHG